MNDPITFEVIRNALVAADVREGKLGVRRAREVYGWR